MVSSLNEEAEDTYLDLALSEKMETLSDNIKKSLRNYFHQLKGEEPTNKIYETIVTAVEAQLLKASMHYMKNNQARTAILLGLSRAGLRGKLKTHGML